MRAQRPEWPECVAATLFPDCAQYAGPHRHVRSPDTTSATFPVGRQASLRVPTVGPARQPAVRSWLETRPAPSGEWKHSQPQQSGHAWLDRLVALISKVRTSPSLRTSHPHVPLDTPPSAIIGRYPRITPPPCRYHAIGRWVDSQKYVTRHRRTPSAAAPTAVRCILNARLSALGLPHLPSAR